MNQPIAITSIDKENISLMAGFLNRVGFMAFMTIASNGMILYTGDVDFSEDARLQFANIIFGYERAIQDIREGHMSIDEISPKKQA